MSGTWARVRVEFPGVGEEGRRACLAALQKLPVRLELVAHRDLDRWRAGALTFIGEGEGLCFEAEADLREGDTAAMREALAERWPLATVKSRYIEYDDWDEVEGPEEGAED